MQMWFTSCSINYKMPKCCPVKQKKKMVAPAYAPPYQKGIRGMPTRDGMKEKKERSLSNSGKYHKLWDWHVGRILGKGHFGCVVQARHVPTKEVVAWKRFSTRRIKSAIQKGSRILEILEREIQIHQR